MISQLSGVYLVKHSCIFKVGKVRSQDSKFRSDPSWPEEISDHDCVIQIKEVGMMLNETNSNQK
jgi:hypothetical protein